MITGVGVVSPLGNSLDSFVQSLHSSRSAVECQTIHEGRLIHVAEVAGFDAKVYVQPRKTIKLICQETQFAFGAAMMACEQAGISQGTIDPDRLAVCFGGEIIFSECLETQSVVKLCCENGTIDHKKWAPLFMSNIYPLWMLKSLPNMAACHVGIALDARGPINTITSDEMSALMAIHEAYVLMQRGAADAVVVGACSSLVNPTRFLQVPQEHFINEQVDAPDIVKPFDKDRVGMARGQGAGCIVLETAEHAAARGAKVLGKLCSVASGFTAPTAYRKGSSKSVSQTLQLALERAGIKADDLDHVNTNAGGSVSLDAAIGNGVANVAPKVPVVAIQGGMGNLGVATGIVELIASIGTASSQALSPHTVNYRNPDSHIAAKIQNEPNRPMQHPYIAKLSHTPHGQSAALVAQLLDV